MMLRVSCKNLALAQMLASTSESPACAACCEPLSTVPASLPPLSGFVCPPPSLCCSAATPCGLLFCSSSCEATAWHRRLCCGGLPDTHPLCCISSHAAASNEAFLLSARVFAATADNLEVLDALPPVAGEGHDTVAERRLRRLLASQLDDGHALLCGAFAAQGLRTPSRELYSRVVSCATHLASPIACDASLTRYVKALLCAPRDAQSAALAVLRPLVEEAARLRRVRVPKAVPAGASPATFTVSSLWAAPPLRVGDAAPCAGDAGESDGVIVLHPAPASPHSGIAWADTPERVIAAVASLAASLWPPVEGVALSVEAAAVPSHCLPTCTFDGDGNIVAVRELEEGETASVARNCTASLDVVNHFTPAELLVYARHLQGVGRTSDALAIFAKLAAGSSANGDAAHGVGVCLIALRRWREAHIAFQAAFSQWPEHPSLRLLSAKERQLWPFGEEVSISERKSSPSFSRVGLNCELHPRQYDAVLSAAPILTASTCADAIAEAEAVALKLGGWTTQRHTHVPTTDLPILSCPRLLVAFNAALRDSISPLLAAAFPDVLASASDLRIHDAFVVRYSGTQQRSLPVHTDEAMLSLTMSLNAPPSFEGGGTFFDDARVVVRPHVGHALAFRGGTLRHGGEATTAGLRFAIAVFCYSVSDL